jgi:hypothetical protein
MHLPKTYHTPDERVLWRAIADRVARGDASLATKLGEDFAGLPAKPMFVKVAERRIFEVDLDGHRASVDRDARQLGGGIDDSGRTDAHEEIASLERFARTADHLGI